VRRAALLALAAVAVLAGGGVEARQPRTEYELKAAYLYSFGRFVEWPASDPKANGDFTICVLGSDPFGPALDATLAGVTLRGRKVVGRRLATAAGAAECHILFISASEERQLEAIVAALARSGVLTVSDMPRFVGRGGMIQFVMSAGRVRFEIDLRPARSAGLVLSSELLRVAAAVRSDREPGE
jgi:hypothetical protein